MSHLCTEVPLELPTTLSDCTTACGSSHPTLLLSPSPFMGIRHLLHLKATRSCSPLIFRRHFMGQVCFTVSLFLCFQVFHPGRSELTHAIIKIFLTTNTIKFTYISCLTTTPPMDLYLAPCNSSIH